MRVCSVCRRCYEPEVYSCIDESHPTLSEMREGGCEIVVGYGLDLLLQAGIKGEVYSAHHIGSGRPCLIRILPARAGDGQLFLRETQLAAALYHPGVVDIYETGTLPGGEFFVVAEDAAGQTLSEYLRVGGVPELLTSIHIVRQAAEALHAIHLKGLTHRAVNPENIILTADTEGRLLVRIRDIDFGGVVERSIISNKFLIDSAVDTLRYFSPEQCSGGAVGIKTDVYSLGIVLHEMLAGSPPFDAPKAAGLIEKHKNERPPEIRIDDFELRMLVTHTLMESLRKLPEKRQSSANAFARQLRHIEQLSTHVSTPPPAGVVPPEPVKVIASFAATEPARAANIHSFAPIETPNMIHMEESELAPANVQEYSFDDLPEIPDLLSAEPGVVNFVPGAEIDFQEKESTHAAPRRSRLKLLRRKLHLHAESIAHGTPEIKLPLISEPVPPKNVQVQAPTKEIAAFDAEPERTMVAAVSSVRTKIEWEQPEDDIPSVAEVLNVLSEEPLAGIPIVYAEPEAIIAVPEAANEIMVDPEEPEEITLVSAPRRQITIEWEQPTALETFLSGQRQSVNDLDEVTFFPTILGNRRETPRMDAEPEHSILSGYYEPSRPPYSVPYRSITIGAGILGLIALFLFGGDVVARFSSTGSSADMVVAKTATATESLPPTAPANAVLTTSKKVPKYFDNPKTDDTDADAKNSKTAPNDDRASLTGEKRETPSGKNAVKGSVVPSTIVIFSENGKTMSRIEPEKRPTENKPVSIADKTTGATRPRIVKEP